jgi:hypothetical protein
MRVGKKQRHEYLEQHVGCPFQLGSAPAFHAFVSFLEGLTGRFFLSACAWSSNRFFRGLELFQPEDLGDDRRAVGEGLAGWDSLESFQVVDDLLMVLGVTNQPHQAFSSCLRIVHRRVAFFWK